MRKNKDLSSDGNRRKRKVLIVWCAILIMLASSLGVFFIQTNGGNVDVIDLAIEADEGTVSMLMYLPDNYKYQEEITDEEGNTSMQTMYNELPCVICVHGNLNHKEMQDYAYVELARRGFVVISMDMYGHGHSADGNPGPDIQAAIDFAYDLSYVDKSMIGITGHSLGAVQIQIAAASNPDKISAVLPVGWSLLSSITPLLPDASLGSIVGKYDEFFYYLNMTDNEGNLNRNENGDLLYETVEDYNAMVRDDVMTASKLTESAYEFNTFYQTENGKTRIVWQEDINHPALVYSMESSRNVISFFDTAWKLNLEGSTGIPNNSIIWGWKVFFHALGLAGFFLFIISFALYLLELPLFTGLKGRRASRTGEDIFECEKPDTSVVVYEDAEKPRGLKETLIYFLPLGAITVLSGLLYYPLMRCELFFDFEGEASYNRFFPYQYANYSMTWAFFMGLISLAVFIIAIFASKAVNKTNTKDSFDISMQKLGLKINLVNFGKSVLLAVTAIFAAYVMVYVFDFFFKTDFRLYTLAIKTFQPEVIKYVFTYFIFFFIFYFANAVTTNANARKGYPEWLNIVIMCAANILGLLGALAFYYIPFLTNGIPNLYESINPVLMFPFIPILCITPIYSRRLYRETGNVYLPAFLNTLLVVIITLTTTRIFIS